MPDDATGVIIQARMGSARLPGKVLMDLCGETILSRVVRRAQAIAGVDIVLVAVPDGSGDDILAAAAEALGVGVSRGPEADVLERFVRAAKALKLTRIVRVTCDNPFLCPVLASAVVAAHRAESLDYASNRNESGSGIPDGSGVEVYSRDALMRIREGASRPEDFEHINEYVFRHKEQFRMRILSVPEAARMPELRLTVDTAEDLERMRLLQTEIMEKGWEAPLLPQIVARAKEGAPWA